MSTTRKKPVEEGHATCMAVRQEKWLHSLGSLEGGLGKCQAPRCNADTNR